MEYVFVTEGRLELTVDGNSYEIGTREFMQFEANRPHEYRCLGEAHATAIMQISYMG